MKILTAIAILGILGSASDAQARTRHHPAHASPRPLVVYAVPPPYVGPPPFGDRYAYFSPPGPYQLASPYHTLCGFTIVTNCSQESSYGP